MFLTDAYAAIKRYHDMPLKQYVESLTIRASATATLTQSRLHEPHRRIKRFP